MKAEEVYALDSLELFCEVMKRVPKGEGIKVKLTPKNVARGDRFLIFSAYKSCVCHLYWKGLLWVDFDNDEPMLLENCPESFYRSILLNVD